MIRSTRLITQVLTHITLGGVTLLGTAFWVNGLLYVGKPAAQAVLTTEALKEALDEPNESPHEGQKKDTSRLAQDAGGSPPPQVSSLAVEAKDGKQPASALPARESIEESPGELTASVGAPPLQETLAAESLAAPPPHAKTGRMLPEQSPELRQAWPIQLANSTTEGGLVSFVGKGLSGPAAEGGSTGGSARFVFEIRFASQLNWQTLQLVNGVLPVVVRQRRDSKEVALVMKDGRISEPVTLQELIQGRPEYEGCWAILLPRERLADVLEQTMNHGYGWEPCCLVEDRRFSQWISAAQDFAHAQRQTPDRIAGFQADAWLVRAGEGADLRLVFRNLLLREPIP